MVELSVPEPHPEGLTEDQEKLSLQLFDIGAIMFGEFRLKHHDKNPHAPLSPIRINLKELPENVLDQVGMVLSAIDSSIAGTPDICAGIPKTGVPLAKSYSNHSGIPMDDIFYKEEKKNSRRIVGKEGVEGRGRRLRLVDDLATGGQTKLEAIEAAEEMGFEIIDVTVVVNRQQGAREDLERGGYILRSALTLDQLLRYGLRIGKITNEQYIEVEEYIKSS